MAERLGTFIDEVRDRPEDGTVAQGTRESGGESATNHR
jgi:hypothetical protein